MSKLKEEIILEYDKRFKEVDDVGLRELAREFLLEALDRYANHKVEEERKRISLELKRFSDEREWETNEAYMEFEEAIDKTLNLINKPL